MLPLYFNACKSCNYIIAWLPCHVIVPCVIGCNFPLTVTILLLCSHRVSTCHHHSTLHFPTSSPLTPSTSTTTKPGDLYHPCLIHLPTTLSYLLFHFSCVSLPMLSLFCHGSFSMWCLPLYSPSLTFSSSSFSLLSLMWPLSHFQLWVFFESVFVFSWILNTHFFLKPQP